jgi:hypothetical protein
MLERIGIIVYTSSNPNAKPNVERSFDNMQHDFFFSFLKKHKANTTTKAQKLVNKCISKYNKTYNKKWILMKVCLSL